MRCMVAKDWVRRREGNGRRGTCYRRPRLVTERGYACHPLGGFFRDLGLPEGEGFGALGTHLGWILGLVGTRASDLRGLGRPGEGSMRLCAGQSARAGVPKKHKILVSKRSAVSNFQAANGRGVGTQGWMEFLGDAKASRVSHVRSF